MPYLARTGDVWSGKCYHNSHTAPSANTAGVAMKGKIAAGSGLTVDEGQGLARIGDVCVADCGHNEELKIVSGSGLCVDEGQALARMGDVVKGTYITGKIVSGSGLTNDN